MHIDDNKLESFMIDSGLVSKSEIELAKSETKKKHTNIGETLVNKGILTEDDLRKTQAYILGIPFVDLKDQKLDFSTLSLIPEPIARNHNIVAFRKINDSLKEANSLRAINEKAGGEDITENELKKLSEDIPVVRIVDTLLSHAIIQDASDIHIEPEEEKVLVRYRIDGILRDAMVLPKNTASGITARIKVLSSLRLDEKRIPQDGRFKIDAGDEKVSFRVTTLYTMLDIVNIPGVNISTIEDPVEYQMARINQTQVRPEIGLTFANGLRTLVRQDPDIIMVGEIRDNETAALAINASLTGHLVFSTLHTNSAA